MTCGVTFGNSGFYGALFYHSFYGAGVRREKAGATLTNNASSVSALLS